MSESSFLVMSDGGVRGLITLYSLPITSDDLGQNFLELLWTQKSRQKYPIIKISLDLWVSPSGIVYETSKIYIRIYA